GLQGHRRRPRIIDDLDVEHEDMIALTTIVVKAIKAFSAEFAESMACRRIVKLRRGLLLWPLVGPTRNRPACVGFIVRRAQAELLSALRSDTPPPAVASGPSPARSG